MLFLWQIFKYCLCGFLFFFCFFGLFFFFVFWWGEFENFTSFIVGGRSLKNTDHADDRFKRKTKKKLLDNNMKSDEKELPINRKKTEYTLMTKKGPPKIRYASKAGILKLNKCRNSTIYVLFFSGRRNLKFRTSKAHRNNKRYLSETESWRLNYNSRQEAKNTRIAVEYLLLYMAVKVGQFPYSWRTDLKRPKFGFTDFYWEYHGQNMWETRKFVTE